MKLTFQINQIVVNKKKSNLTRYLYFQQIENQRSNILAVYTDKETINIIFVKHDTIQFKKLN